MKAQYLHRHYQSMTEKQKYYFLIKFKAVLSSKLKFIVI